MILEKLKLMRGAVEKTGQMTGRMGDWVYHSIDDVYDHQDQAEIRAAARGVVERVAGAGDRFQLQADAEAILTVHFKCGGEEQRFSAAEASQRLEATGAG